MLDITAAASVPAHDWTEIRVERLTAMWAQGFSATQIGGELGVTRNAVLGKLHRLGKADTAPERKKTPLRGPNRIPRAKKAPTPVLTRAQKAVQQRERYLAKLFGASMEAVSTAPPMAPAGQSCSLLELSETSCRFPNGDPSTRGFHFCGAVKPSGTPYCAFHHRIAYVPRQPSKSKFIMWGRR